MLRSHIVLLIAIRPSDGDVKPGGPIGAFRKEQAMSWHRLSHSPFLSSSSYATQLHYTNCYTNSHPNLNFLQHCTDTLPTRNVVCPSGAWFENRPHLTPSIRLARNPKRIIVQCVCIRTDRQIFVHLQVVRDYDDDYERKGEGETRCRLIALRVPHKEDRCRWVWSIFESCTAWADHITCGTSICIVYWRKLRLGWLYV